MQAASLSPAASALARKSSTSTSPFSADWTASAVLMPYGSLAAVRGRHAAMMGLRVVEAIVSLTSLFLLLRALHVDVSYVPYALALGSLAMGVVARQMILVPTAREEERAAARRERRRNARRAQGAVRSAAPGGPRSTAD